MSTQSPTDFEWSVKLIGGEHFCVGIASELQREVESYIDDYDPSAILYIMSSYSPPEIEIGSEIIHSNLTRHQSGDVVRFRFQPNTKKLLIDLVSFWNYPSANWQIKDYGHYEMDLEDGIEYFPVVQCIGNYDNEAHLLA